MNFLQTISGKVLLYSTICLVATKVHFIAGAVSATVLGIVILCEVVAREGRG